MTWAQHHERMAFIAGLTDRAADNPDAALNFNGNLPDVGRRVRFLQRNEQQIVEALGVQTVA